MLQKFPGRTLEELDDVDWLRLRRAQDAQTVIDIEDRRTMHRENGTEIDDDLLSLILAHDEIASES